MIPFTVETLWAFHKISKGKPDNWQLHAQGAWINMVAFKFHTANTPSSHHFNKMMDELSAKHIKERSK